MGTREQNDEPEVTKEQPADTGVVGAQKEKEQDAGQAKQDDEQG